MPLPTASHPRDSLPNPPRHLSSPRPKWKRLTWTSLTGFQGGGGIKPYSSFIVARWHCCLSHDSSFWVYHSGLFEAAFSGTRWNQPPTFGWISPQVYLPKENHLKSHLFRGYRVSEILRPERTTRISGCSKKHGKHGCFG